MAAGAHQGLLRESARQRDGVAGKSRHTRIIRDARARVFDAKVRGVSEHAPRRKPIYIWVYRAVGRRCKLVNYAVA